MPFQFWSVGGTAFRPHPSTGNRFYFFNCGTLGKRVFQQNRLGADLRPARVPAPFNIRFADPKKIPKNLSPLSPRILSYPHIPHFGGVLEASLTWGLSVPGGAASREPMPPGGAWWSRPSSPDAHDDLASGLKGSALRLSLSQAVSNPPLSVGRRSSGSQPVCASV